MKRTLDRLVSFSLIRTLIVDDDEFMLDLTNEMLRELGILSIATASTGNAGLTLFDSAIIKPNLLLIDLHMPGGDGFQLMQELAKRDYEGAVILISGQQTRVLHSAELMAQLHQLNILAALEKPVNRAILRDTIKKLL